MATKRLMNTKENGAYRIFFYPTKNGWCGVCPEFGIVDYYGDRSSLDDLKIFENMLNESAEMYLKSVVEGKLSEDLLNKKVSFVHWVRIYWLISLAHLKMGLERKYSTDKGSISVC